MAATRGEAHADLDYFFGSLHPWRNRECHIESMVVFRYYMQPRSRMGMMLQFNTASSVIYADIVLNF